MRKQRGQSAVEFALVAPMIFLMVFGAIYGGIMFLEFMNYSNEARRIARDIAVASATPSYGEEKSPRQKLVEKYNGVAAKSEEELLGGIYKVTLTTSLLKDGVSTNSSDTTADEVGVYFVFDHGREFPFGFPPKSFAASYRMMLEDN